MNKIIDGQKISSQIQSDLEGKLIGKKLGVFVIGDDMATNSFIRIKKKIAEKIGVDYLIFKYKEGISEEEFLKSFIEKQKQMDGVIIQLPLPASFDVKNILKQIDLVKDVDLLNPESMKKFKDGEFKKIYPPVAGAVDAILKFKNINFSDKNIVVIGKGKLTGEPVGYMLKIKE
jgi:methylenetetrahydrofolate dehydrogenase (NADP+)/methenyltetrahydrofolate cyclohydrolase